MKSQTTADFWKLYKQLPKHIQIQAKTTYRFWREYPNHPSLHFKRVGKNTPIYSIRIGRKWRALGLQEGGTIEWFWIGSHEAYNNLIAKK